MAFQTLLICVQIKTLNNFTQHFFKQYKINKLSSLIINTE